MLQEILKPNAMLRDSPIDAFQNFLVDGDIERYLRDSRIRAKVVECHRTHVKGDESAYDDRKRTLSCRDRA
jgi:hypothetical protein